MASVPSHADGRRWIEEAMRRGASKRNGAYDGMATSAGGAATSMEGGAATSMGGGAATSMGGAAGSPAGTVGKRKKNYAVRSLGETGKGLRHFSLKVCEKVETKGRTTYNEVADELVAEMTGPGQQMLDQQYDEKNIRRRVYDALNVLLAMDIVAKERKEIVWKGLPPSSDFLDMLHHERRRVHERLDEKRQTYQELQEQVVATERLVQRNEAKFANGMPPGSGVGLPFILVQTSPQAIVEVEISEDMQVVHFDFGSSPFELHDDSFVLRAMGLAHPPLDAPPGDALMNGPPPESTGATAAAGGGGEGPGDVRGQRGAVGYATAVPGPPPEQQGGYATPVPGPWQGQGQGQAHQGHGLVQGPGVGRGGASGNAALDSSAPGAGVNVSGIPGQGLVYRQAAGAQPGAAHTRAQQEYGSAPASFTGAGYGEGYEGAGAQAPDPYYAAGRAYGVPQYQQVQQVPAQQVYTHTVVYQQVAPRPPH